MIEKIKITLQEILYWIIDNNEDIEAMDKINKATFPFTTRYSNWSKKHENPQEEQPEKRKRLDFELEDLTKKRG